MASENQVTVVGNLTRDPELRYTPNGAAVVKLGVAVSRRIKGVIGADGGDVTKVDQWGRRRLAFEIDKQSEGFYVVAEMNADPASIKELDRVLSLADDVVRFKVVVRAA